MPSPAHCCQQQMPLDHSHMVGGIVNISAAGLSPNDITPGEATPRRVVAQLPVPDGVATRRHFPAWRLQRQGHLARFFRILVRATCAIPILPAPDAPHGS